MKAKYDRIGTGYNQTRRADPYLCEQLLHYLNPEKTGLYLDIGCGTGNYTIELQKRGFDFIGIDPSCEMLEKAKSRNKKVDWRIGDVESTDLDDSSIDGVLGSLTIHHWPDLAKGFLELFRILKEKGKLVIFTSTPKQMAGYWLNHYFPVMMKDSMQQMPKLAKINEDLREAGFTEIETAKYFVPANLKDHFLYCGKHRPELYFEEQVRAGISSFRALANRVEIRNGLMKLKRDIQSNEIKGIIKSYENSLGDYFLITAS